MNKRTAVPFYFGPRSRALFGWYHPAAAESSRGVGVVLCNTVGNEAVGVAQKTLLYVAEHLVKAGFSVLRFEFHGNGDSMGYQSDADRVPTWLDDIDLAIAELRARSGVEKMCLAGIRLGGTLAITAAARRKDINSLLLWDPYYTGKKFVGDQTTLHRVFEAVSALPQKWPAGPVDGKEALGFLLSSATIADLGKIDLLAIDKCPAQKICLVGPARVQQKAGEALLKHLTALGAEAKWQLLADQLSRDIQLVTNASHRIIAADIAAGITSMHEDDLRMPRTAPATATSAAPSSGNEQPLLFGPQDSLFGVLTSPAPGQSDADRPVVITMVHRLGPNRNYVRMARELAALGFSVLRLDLSGRGDSMVETPEEEENPYPARTLADVRDAMDFLEKKISAKRFIVAGLCSGADLALQCSLDDPRVVGLVMINPRTFAHYDIPTLETLLRSQELGKFMGKFLDKKNWLKLLRGEFSKGGEISKVDTKSPLGKLADAIKLKLKTRREEKRNPQTGGGGIKTVPGNFRTIGQRGVKTLLLVRKGDLGVTYVDANCGKAMRALENTKNFRRVTVTDVDHNFTTLYAQQELMRAITAHFSEVHSKR